MYATALELLQRFGDREMAERGAPDAPEVTGALLRLTVEGGDRSAYSQAEQDAADTALARIEGALDDATKTINSYLIAYTLPLEQALIDASNLPQINGDMARYHLYDDGAPEFVKDRYDAAMKWLRDIAAGKASLGPEDTSAAAPTGRVVARQGCSRFDWGSY